METREIEKKFSVHGLFSLPELASPDDGILAVERRAPLTLRATYVDTPTLQLARDGITLRHRTGEGADRWTLKLPGREKPRSGLQRTEISVAGPPTDVPSELAGLLIGVLRGASLGPVACLATARETYALLGAERELLGELVDDTVSLLDGRRVVSRFREIEVEETDSDGSARACRAVGRRLLDAGAVAGEQLPKVVRALGPQAQQPSDLPPPPPVDAHRPAADLVTWSLRTGLARLVAADLAVRRSEPDAVHQMRVACRRMRSDLRTFAALLDDPRVGRLREELAWLAGCLGEARDLEVLQARVARTAAADPLCRIDDGGLAEIRRRLADQESLALAQVGSALASPRYVELLQLLFQTASEPVTAKLAERSCHDVLPALVGAAWYQLAKRVRRLRSTDPDQDWHRARILAKRARYAADVAAVAVGKPAKRTAKSATQVQELLGEHQDAAFAAERLLALAADAPGNVAFTVACGRLAERERTTVRELRRSFLPVWRDVKNGASGRWLDR